MTIIHAFEVEADAFSKANAVGKTDPKGTLDVVSISHFIIKCYSITEFFLYKLLFCNLSWNSNSRSIVNIWTKNCHYTYINENVSYI